jgi:hypothetical protein
MTRLLLVCALVLTAGVAMAKPPQNADPTLAPWFQSLRQPSTGISCCSLADCRQVDYRIGSQGYEAFADNRWVTVPSDKVLQRTDNPTGRGVLCRTPGGDILCFVAAAET